MYKGLFFVVILLFASLLFGCLQPRIQADKKKAERTARKYDTRLRAMHPDLARFDTLKVTKHDTIRIDSVVNTVRFEVQTDTIYIDSVLTAYRVPEGLKKQIVNNYYKDTVFTYADSIISISAKLKEKKIDITYILQEKALPYITEIIEKPKIEYVEDCPQWHTFLIWINLIMLFIIVLFVYVSQKKGTS